MLFVLSLSSVGQPTIKEILSNAKYFNETVELAENYFEERHGDKTAAELCEGEF